VERKDGKEDGGWGRKGVDSVREKRVRGGRRWREWGENEGIWKEVWRE
jgi:hypothetical protein